MAEGEKKRKSGARIRESATVRARGLHENLWRESNDDRVTTSLSIIRGHARSFMLASDQKKF